MGVLDLRKAALFPHVKIALALGQITIGRDSLMTRKRWRDLTPPPSKDLFIEPAYIADQLGLSADDFERYRNLGLINVTVECGCGEQQDLNRVKCCLGNRVWEAMVDSEGAVAFEATTYLRGKLAKLSRRR